jgi:hypothetical protein
MSRSRVRSSARSQGVRQGDVDETLVGRRVVVVVSVGNKVAKVVGTITAMGRFWVIVSVEESEIPTLQGTVYLNKGSVVAYMPLPGNNHDSNHDSNPRS